MSIKIYTYANPYEIDAESYWGEIRNACQFCASQTMVNGLSQTYKAWGERKHLTTIRSLVNALYADWDSLNTKVKQIMEVDNAINYLSIEGDNADNIRRSLLFNTKSIAESIRILCELGIGEDDLHSDKLNIDQQYLVAIYKFIKKRESTSFAFKHVGNETAINNAITYAICSKNNAVKLDSVDVNTVVIHGIHQFTPSMLCAIEDLAKWKNVILLFNYQEQYKSIYNTWLSIYSLFDKKIICNSENQFTPTSLLVNSYGSNILGDCFGKLSNGIIEEYNDEMKNLEVIEFENMTEFANYAARIFENAEKQRDESHKKAPALAYMSEQMYAASGKVNDILRAYFPAQFGERHFLDYPIGHFFVATINMWDSEKECVKVVDFSDLRECLGAGIISESSPGILLSTFDKTNIFFEKETTLSDIITKLKKLNKYVGSPQGDKARVGYFNVTKDHLSELINALQELNSIIKSFFVDFNRDGDNFQRFYNRIQKFIINRVSNLSDIDDEMKVVLEKLIKRLEQSNLPDTGTFTCLKQTMSYYLSQDDNLNHGAQWIVRGFEQIDGDILRSNFQDHTKTLYHFCCLSDRDIYSDKNAKLPWPLDLQFFEYAHIATEQKYRIFVKSKMEYHNFNRCALLYGLVFNRLACKLSYVKYDGGKENDLFYVFKMLGIKVRKYKSYENSSYVPRLKYKKDNGNALKDKLDNLSTVDKYKAILCPYRFVLESIIQERTEFREMFLIHNYVKVLIIHKLFSYFIVQLLGSIAFNDSDLRESIMRVYQEMSDKFKLDDEIEKTKMIASVYTYIKSNLVVNKKYKLYSDDLYKKVFKLKEDFLWTDLKAYNIADVKDYNALIESKGGRCNYGTHCKYCASKDICLEHKFYGD